TIGSRRSRTNHQNSSNSRRNFTPTAVLTKSGIVPVSAARKSSLRAATSVSAARPINIAASKPLVNVAKPKKMLYKQHGAPQDDLKYQGYFDSGCSWHITGNISYLTDFKEHDGGYVAFGGRGKGGKITGKGTIRAATKDETSRILKSFITEIENLVEKKVKIIICDNGTEFKNRVMNDFCEEKCIKRKCSVARTPQQNGVAKRRNRTLIEAARTILADSKLSTTFWAEVVNTAYQLGKFNGKLDDGIFVGYSTTSKAFRVYNIRTKKVEENLHITFLENKPMIVGTNSNDFEGKGASFDAGQSSMKIGSSQDYFLMPLWKDTSLFVSSSQASNSHNKDKHGPSQASESDNQEKPNAESSNKTVNTTGPVNTATPIYAKYPNDPLMSNLEDVGIFDDAYDDRDEGAEADYYNLETVIPISPIPSTRIHKDHPKEHIIGEMEPKKVNQALDDESWVEAMQEELLQFKLLNV
nr:hypothetical protein [Tanacetum cinerariifolium]